MGDILHTLPALTECLAYCPSIQFDWVVEPGFKEILGWHQGIQKVYTFPLRLARKNPKLFFTEIPQVLKTLRAQHYDLVIDAQGLIKSAVLAKIINAKKVVGLDKNSCREPFASRFYDKGYAVPWSEHAVMRVKKLFSEIFHYSLDSRIQYGIDQDSFIKPKGFLPKLENKYLIFLHGTTWKTKHWPEGYWQKLIALVCLKNKHIMILLPWGSESELRRAKRLADNFPQVKVLPKLSLTELAYYLVKAQSVVAVDTGLGHLAAALGTHTVNIYGSTDSSRTGARGDNQVHLSVRYPCAPCLKRECIHLNQDLNQDMPPCYVSLSPERVMENLNL